MLRPGRFTKQPAQIRAISRSANCRPAAYEVDVTVPGFKKYVRTGLTVEVAATVRVDISLEVGSAQESVTVNAEAPLLKTESGEMSHNVTTETLDNLPVLGVGASAAGSSGIRKPHRGDGAASRHVRDPQLTGADQRRTRQYSFVPH